MKEDYDEQTSGLGRIAGNPLSLSTYSKNSIIPLKVETVALAVRLMALDPPDFAATGDGRRCCPAGGGHSLKNGNHVSRRRRRPATGCPGSGRTVESVSLSPCLDSACVRKIGPSPRTVPEAADDILPVHLLLPPLRRLLQSPDMADA